MILRSQFPDPIFWRVFNAADTVYLVGLNQGRIERSGPPAEWHDDSFPQIKVEVKTGDIVFSSRVLARPGRVFPMAVDLTVDHLGRLEVTPRNITMRPSNVTEIFRNDIQFFDNRTGNVPAEQTITSGVESTFAVTGGIQQSNEHERTWNIHARLGGTVGTRHMGEGMGAGGSRPPIEATGEVTVGFHDRAVRTLETSYEQHVTAAWKREVHTTYTFQPGQIYVIDVAWTLRLQHGVISDGIEATTYSAVVGAESLRTTASSYSSVALMPPQYQQHPGAPRS